MRKKLRVGRSDYRLKYNKVLENLEGYCDPDAKVICVSKSATGRNALLTYIHELVHAECAESGLRQTPMWSIDKEEILCEGIAHNIVDNLIDILPQLKKQFKL